MIKDKIAGKKVKSLYFYDKKVGEYELKILIELENNIFLFFDSTQFNLLYSNEILSQYDWKLYDLILDYAIKNVKEEELRTYFVLFEDETILYIYQKIIDLENWYQDFNIVNEFSPDYKDIKEHMEEDWIEEV